MTRRRTKSPWKGALGVGLIGASVLAAAALFIVPTLAPRPPRDPDSGCRLDAPAPAHTLVFIDATESFAARHKRILAAAVARAQQRLPKDGRLSIVALDADDPDEPRWLASLCSPGDGSDANPLFANPERLYARWKTGFAAPLDQAAALAGADRGDVSSPIVAGLRSVVRDPRFAEAKARRLTLVSDLMENTQRLSLYDETARFAPATAPPAKLDDVAVEVVLIDRPRAQAPQATAWTRFWRDWFEASGATVEAAP